MVCPVAYLDPFYLNYEECKLKNVINPLNTPLSFILTMRNVNPFDSRYNVLLDLVLS